MKKWYSRKKAVPVYAKNGNFVGTLKGNVLTKRAHASRHLFRSIGDKGSWGIDYNVLFDLPSNGVIEVHEMEEEVIYRTTVERFKRLGTILHFKEDTEDHEVQLFLPLQMWDIIRLSAP